MAYIPRWRLMCGPDSSSCKFVLTHPGGSLKDLRAECTEHKNAFRITYGGKGVLKVEGLDRPVPETKP